MSRGGQYADAPSRPSSDMTAPARLLRLSTAFLLLLFFVLLAACGGWGSPADAESRDTLTIKNSSGAKHRLQIEVADTPEKRTHGLMGRTEIPDGYGMIFIYDQGRNGLWMKDTLIPLSAAFIDRCGAILALVDMQPLSLEIHNPQVDYLYGLEVKGGWFAAHRIAVGDKATLPTDLRDASCK